MNNHIPLNGARVIDKIHAALRGQATSESAPVAIDPIQAALEEFEDDAPDGTGGATKSEPAEGRSRAIDPSQGKGPARRTTPKDPIAEALSRMGRGGSRRRF